MRIEVKFGQRWGQSLFANSARSLLSFSLVKVFSVKISRTPCRVPFTQFTNINTDTQTPRPSEPSHWKERKAPTLFTRSSTTAFSCSRDSMPMAFHLNLII